MKKLVSTLLAGALLLSLLVTTAFAAEKITVSGKAGDTSVKVTVTGLKANSYYFGAIRMDGSVLNLFDGSANADGKLEMEVNVGTKLEVDDKLTVAISGANAGTDSVTNSFTVTKTEIRPGNPSGGDDKPTYPTLPEDTYWISTYYNNRGTISVYSRAEAGETVWVRLYPKSGYYADGLTVTDRLGYQIDAYYEGNDRYTFTMPASDVWLDGIFVSSYVSRPSYNYTPPANNVPQNNTPSYNGGTISYRDVPRNSWYYNAVQYAYRYDLMSGTGGGNFSPNQITSRAMVTTILHNMAGRPAPGGGTFDDVASGAWYADSVIWAARNKIAQGYGGFFRPNENVTREQMALMMYNYAKLQGCDVSAQSGLTTFSDTGMISTQTLKAVRWANAVGLLNGVSGGRLDPKGLITRAQIASILMNYRENVL